MKRIANVRMVALLISATLIIGLILISCLKSDNEDNNTQVAGLMAFNLAPDQAFTGFALSGNSITANPLAFKSYTGGYLSVYPGQRSVEAFNFNSGATLAATTFNFEPQRYYSLFLVGTGSSYENLIVKDDFDSLASATQAFIRYINAIPDSSTPTVTIASSGTNVVNDNAVYKSISAFTAIDPGEITIHITNGGTIEAERTITLEAQKVYTVLLAGMPGTTGDNAVQIKYIQNGTVEATTGRPNNLTGLRSAM